MAQEEIDTGAGGFLLSYSAFLEYLEGSKNWAAWKHENAVDREHIVFVSAYTYGLVQFKNRSEEFRNKSRIKDAFRLFRNSSMNSRLIDVDADIMDIAAQSYADAHDQENYQNSSDLTPFIEFATAAHWNLELVITDAADDPFSELAAIIAYPKAIMKVFR